MTNQDQVFIVLHCVLQNVRRGRYIPEPKGFVILEILVI